MSYLQDTPFLTELTKQKLKTIYVKILILDKHDIPIDSIEGRVTTGTININGDSAIRRAGSLTFVASESDDISVTDVKHILSMNKRIKILEKSIMDLWKENNKWYTKELIFQHTTEM